MSRWPDITRATHITRHMRRRWIDLFADYSARVEIVYVEPPVATLLAQNKCRPRPVPEGVIQRWLETLEPPTITECHQLLVVCGDPGWNPAPIRWRSAWRPTANHDVQPPATSESATTPRTVVPLAPRERGQG